MKLYTEEQIIETFSTGVLSLYNGYIKERLETLTPIELSSDDEIVTTVYNIIYEQDTTNKKSCLSLSEEIFDLIKKLLNQNK